MRLIGYRQDGRVRVAAELGGGRVRDLADAETFWADPDRWGAAGAGPELELADLDQAPPLRPSARVLCVGLNYRAHAAEGGFTLPEHPAVFGRWVPSMSVSGVPVTVPAGEPGLDWEGELAVVVGRHLTGADAAEAQAGLLGYAVFNDITARRAQRHSSQWTVGKNVDRSGPLGLIHTTDEVPGLADGLRLTTRINGEVVQDASTSDMVFDPATIASYLSQTMTLLPGDVIATGTPAGVGHARTPEWFAGDGDVVDVEIESLGSVRTPVVAVGTATTSTVAVEAAPAGAR